MTHYISSDWLSLSALSPLLQPGTVLALSTPCQTAVANCYAYLQQQLLNPTALHYGINTGFGSLCDIRIDADQLAQLQANLVRSHACGLGDLVPPEVVRLILLLKIQSLGLGHSGVSPALLQRLLDWYNEGVLPVLYEQGSLGASGDLAPLAHFSLPLIGEGEVHYKGERLDGEALLQRLGWAPLTLQPKEGLALLNGTQFSTGYAAWSWIRGSRLMDWADVIAALSIDVFGCRNTPFDARLHQVRAHDGQVDTAARLRHLREGSALANSPKSNVQDPYAFRCVPQVHGATKDTLQHAAQVLEREINSITDNPNIFPESDAILSGGNFHAQPIALIADFMAIALAELGSISERRLYQLISGQRGLPPFLTAQSGLHSGLMIAQYTAAGIVSQNKQLCTPASVDSIVSCNGQEDHVSMAANAGTKLYRVVHNLERLLAIELMAAAQAHDFLPQKTSPLLEKLVAAYRVEVPVLEGDRMLSKDLHRSIAFLQEHAPSAYLQEMN